MISLSPFTAWHRYYLLRFEQALQEVSGDPTIMLPYWDWTDHSGTRDILFQDDFIGPSGDPASEYDVMSGYFAYSAPGTGGNPTPAPAWWPAGLAGWRIHPDLDGGFGSAELALARRLGGGGALFPSDPADPFAVLAGAGDIDTALGATTYAQIRSRLEANPRMHNDTHVWVGGDAGHMSSARTSPNDPIFFLHHCNVDRLWAMWQIDGHQGDAFYPDSGQLQGHNLDNLMYPWVGAAAGYSSNLEIPGFPFPDFAAEPGVTPADMLNHRALGYAYDTEPIVGLALDQTGSMTGMTPDPMTGMAPNISKWDAAKQGVSFFFQDCETAYEAREAYVTGGVETFRNDGGNIFTKIFPATPPYGLIKEGTDYSRASFDAEIAGEAPDGSTPLAGALSDTDTELVRAPHSNEPAGEQRYLCILTDGLETAAPPLSSLGEPQFPDTVVFAMGFGIGGGWDGVSYAAIEDLTQKGKPAPGGMDQIFHGENAGAINKFYTNSLAAAIGYTPATDPVFELFPGEYVMTPFNATDADQSFMIVGLGFDLNDKNWDFCLMSPAGHVCLHSHLGSHPREEDCGHDHSYNHGIGSDHGSAGFRITVKKRNGRCTIFLQRDGAPSSEWVGTWYVMASYKVDFKDGLKAMIMPERGSFLLAEGAPPIRGPLYGRYDQKVADRQAARMLPGSEPHDLATMLPGVSVPKKGPPCAVSVNVYNKTGAKVDFAARAIAPYAGRDIDLAVSFSDQVGSAVTIQNVRGRLIAPGYSLGNIFQDHHSIPLDARKKYIARRHSTHPFDVLAYAADYESKNPDAFPIRDEKISFVREADGVWRSQIRGNNFPGIYHIVAYIEGLYQPPASAHECCPRGPQRFTRVLAKQIVLGIHPDAQKSRPTVHWTAPNKITVSVTPEDALGNAILPGSDPALSVSINGIRAAGKYINDYSGVLSMEIALQGSKIRPDLHGRTLTGAATVSATDGGEIKIKSGREFRVEISIGGTVMHAKFPEIIGNTRTRRAYRAGAKEAMGVPLADREPFMNEREAKAARFVIR